MHDQIQAIITIDTNDKNKILYLQLRTELLGFYPIKSVRAINSMPTRY